MCPQRAAQMTRHFSRQRLRLQLRHWRAASRRRTVEIARRWHAFHHEFNAARRIQRWMRERWEHAEQCRHHAAAVRVQTMVRCRLARRSLHRRAFKARVAEYMVRERREDAMRLEDNRSAVVRREYEAWKVLNRVRRFLFVDNFKITVRCTEHGGGGHVWPLKTRRSAGGSSLLAVVRLCCGFC